MFNEITGNGEKVKHHIVIDTPKPTVGTTDTERARDKTEQREAND